MPNAVLFLQFRYYVKARNKNGTLLTVQRLRKRRSV
jgi:hypothetical protein